jgi:hypothetical protein
MRPTITAVTIVLLGLSMGAADDRRPQASPPPPPGNITIDIGQFAPEARGIVIQFGRQPDGTNRFRLDVPQRNIHLDLSDDGTSPLGNLDLSKLLQGLQPPGAQPIDPNSALDPSVELGEPSVELGEPSVELGEPQSAAPEGSEPSLEPSATPSTPAGSAGVDLGTPQPQPFGVPDPPEPGLAPAEGGESAAATSPGGYLGVVAESVPEALAAHFAELLPDEGGLLVTRVMADSPSAAAGLKAHDILTRYNETALSSLAQLTALARSGKPGDEVKLQLIRGGKALELQTTLGSAPASAPAASTPPLVPE